MAFVNFATREITAKIVYYGPGLGGKTTSLQFIHSSLSPENRGKMISLATEEDRTIYFDFLPLNLGKIQDFAVRVQLYTVPGQVRYNATRKLVLRGADGVVFVADSQKHKKLANLESFNNMEENLRELAKDLRDLPHVLQFNKVDLPGIMTSEELNQVLNKYNVPFYESVATTGIGVLDSLKSITKLVFNDLSKKALLQKKSRGTTTSAGAASEYTLGGSFSGGSSASAASAVKTAPPPPAVPPPPPPVPEPAAPAASYYSDAVDEPEEIVHDDIVEKMEDTYSDIHDSYSELELEPHSALESEDVDVTEIGMDMIEEVEPIAEFDEPEEIPDLEPAAVAEPPESDELELPSQEMPEEKDAEFTVEEPVISVPIVPIESAEETVAASVEPPVVEPEPFEPEPFSPEPAAPAPQPVEAPFEQPAALAGPSFTYSAFFDENSAELAQALEKMEQQFAGGDSAGALATARAAYDLILHRMFPESLALDGTETSRILALDVKFRRFARFKSLLWAEPTPQNLLFVHHFLCELYLSVKEL